MSISTAMLLRFVSGVPYGFRDRQRFELVPKMTTTKMCKKSSQQSDQSCFCTNTRTTHTRQSKPYRRLGAVRARVVGARGRCCPSATVPVADVFPCGVCCCIAENAKKKSSTEKQGSAIIVHKPKRTATSTRTHTRQNKPYRLGAAPAGVVGARGRCCPAATVPVAVVFACGVCWCIAGYDHIPGRPHPVCCMLPNQ